MERTILITVDLEDWFQVENFKEYVQFSQWNDKELRFEKNTQTLLSIFEKHKIKATFFILGWNAERAPGLVQEIHARGHEIASHGYKHDLCFSMSKDELREDLLKSKSILEDITGIRVRGYRAPGFSISDTAIDLLKKTGYSYDSSYNSVCFNKRHGKLNLENYRKKYYALKDPQGFWELPVSNLKVGSAIIPWGGGGYFRLFNAAIFHAGVSNILKNEQVYNFYMHPWEIDPEQPRVSNANLFFKFRHYINLQKCQKNLRNFFNVFQDCTFLTCAQYLKHIDKTGGSN